MLAEKPRVPAEPSRQAEEDKCDPLLNLPHEEDAQLLGAVRVVLPAELPQGVLVVPDQSPDGDGVSYSVSYHLIQWMFHKT